MKRLKFALTFNAIFSLVTGLLLVTMPDYISQLFGVTHGASFFYLGLSLVLFSIIVLYVSRQRHIHILYALIISLLDLIWVLASLIILILDPLQFKMTGDVIIAAVALIVLSIAIMQLFGIAKVDQVKSDNKVLSFERIVPGNNIKVWNIISDVANYHRVAPNIDDVQIISGNGEGMVRQCSQGKSSWTEECIDWKDGEQFSFKVNTDDPNYPFPLSFLQGTWKVASANNGESKIELVFEFQYKRKAFNVLLHPLMAPKFKSIAEELLDNWEKKITSEI
jgi:ribosome-associated toxin RatA of RatAB toxin-antitoxin module